MFSSAALKARVSNVHAPQQGIREEEVHDSFYTSFRRALGTVPAGWLFVVCGDLNTNMGPSTSLGCDNGGGRRLRDLLGEFHHAALNTLYDNPDLTTWRSTASTEHRLDCVFISPWAVGIHEEHECGERK